MNASMVNIVVVGSGKPQPSELAQRARCAGMVVARIGSNLITGGGKGAMHDAAEGFCRTPDRVGKSIGILPGEAVGGQFAWGVHRGLSIRPKPGYPNQWIEVPIRTHLPGQDPKSEKSRNYLTTGSASVLLALPGGKGTQAELEIALSLGIPTVAWLHDGENIGQYAANNLPQGIRRVTTEMELAETLREALSPFALARPTFTKLKNVYKKDSASIHSCSMMFPNTCAIRMSEALVKVIPDIQSKFIASGVNLCPHNHIRGAQDLASVLRRADVFGTYDAGFGTPGSAPSELSGKQGILAYANIPNFSGQGHIDLWDGSGPVGEAYWDADPIWFWKLP